jgi:DNA-binding transcriptional MerR regulator
MSRLVTIGEAARELGVSTKTLRRYEERGLLKPIRTMGGQRRYYLSSLQEVLASAEDEEADVVPTSVKASAPQPPRREPSVWDEVEEEKASFEALKIRAQRQGFLTAQQEHAERLERERQATAAAEKREAEARAAREQAALEQQRALKALEYRFQVELSLADMWLFREPKEAHGPIRKALLSLLTPARIPVGTSPDRISQLVQDEVEAVAAPFRRVREMRASALKYADREIEEGRLPYLDQKRLRDSVDAELTAQLSPDWTPRRAERLVDAILDELWPES